MPVDDDKADSLLGDIVGRVDLGCGDELKVGVPMKAEAFGQVVDFIEVLFAV